jgi:transposase, IS5 family
MKLHIGADSHTGLIHSAQTTAANVHDSQVLFELLHGGETRVYGDRAYHYQKEAIKQAAPNAKDFTNEKASRGNALTDEQKAKNGNKSAVLAAVEHPFLAIKRLWGYAKTRYRGLAKNHNRLITMCALFNVYKANVRLAA